MKSTKVIFTTILVLNITSLKGISEDGWFIPRQNGNMQWVSEEQAYTMLRADLRRYDPETDVKYLLYTKGNPKAPQELKEGDDDAIASSLFKKEIPTRFIVHGYLDDCESEMNVLIRDAFLSVDEFNIISVDWSYASKKPYPTTVLSVPDVARDLAKFIDFLAGKAYIKLEELTLVGHDLGAHVCGIAAKNVESGKINTIVGLDPALGMYSIDDCRRRLCHTDAVYVESIQTNGDMWGFLQPIGKGSFYVSGGEVQPGCYFDITGQCSHKRAYKFYAEAVRYNNFMAYKCLNYERANSKLCARYADRDVKMGAPTNNQTARGVYLVEVNSRSPYGKGPMPKDA